MGYIYILTNPSFPDYVKIGYADDVEKRLAQLNRSECIPYAFRVYATYEVDARLTDMKVHSMIDRLNPNLRTREVEEGKKRVREFYAMSPNDAYLIFEAMAEIHGTADKLVRWKPTAEEEAEQSEADENSSRAKPFSFDMCDIKPGSNLEFWKTASAKTDITCTVVDNKHVKYNGDIYSLTALATSLLGRKNSVAGPMYFKYKGEWLNDIRDRNGR